MYKISGKFGSWAIVVWLSLLFVASTPSTGFSQLAKGRSKFVGNIISSGYSIPSDFTEYWDQVTPENAGKWGSVQGTDTSSYNWGQLDAIYNFAISHDFPFKDHNLIWGSQQPAFMTNGSLDSVEEYRAINNWIDSCGTRYPKAAFCDVVNEPIHTQPVYKQALGGSGVTGWDWVINAFELARKYFSPTTKLLLNEYGILNSTTTTAEYLQIIRLLQARGLIDGIGVQAHYFSVQGTSLSLMETNLDSLATTGLPIYISEFDINEQSDQTQLQDYQSIFPLLYQFPDVKGVTLWGYQEYYTWVPYSYLVTDRNAPRPALQWLQSYFASYLQATLSSPVDTTGVSRNPLLTWNASTAATSYDVQVATDSSFSDIVADTTVADTSVRLSPLAANTQFYWHVLATNSTDTGVYSGTGSFTTGDQVTGVSRTEDVPVRFALSQNYPNPFNPTTNIGYRIANAGFVSLKVYDVLGREVRTLVNEVKKPGSYEVGFDAGNLPSGVYFYRLQAGDVSITKKLVLVK